MKENDEDTASGYGGRLGTRDVPLPELVRLTSASCGGPDLTNDLIHALLLRLHLCKQRGQHRCDLWPMMPCKRTQKENFSFTKLQMTACERKDDTTRVPGKRELSRLDSGA